MYSLISCDDVWSFLINPTINSGAVEASSEANNIQGAYRLYSFPTDTAASLDSEKVTLGRHIAATLGVANL